MSNLPSITTLRIFIRNRRLSGWSDAKIADAIRTRLRLDTLQPDDLTEPQLERYTQALELVRELEAQQEEAEQ